MCLKSTLIISLSFLLCHYQGRISLLKKFQVSPVTKLLSNFVQPQVTIKSIGRNSKQPCVAVVGHLHAGDHSVSTHHKMAVQLAEVVEYTNCISAEMSDLPNECPGYNIKQSDCKASAWELWRIWSTLSLPLLPGPLWSRMVAPDKVLSMGQIELYDI